MYLKFKFCSELFFECDDSIISFEMYNNNTILNPALIMRVAMVTNSGLLKYFTRLKKNMCEIK